jgi:hypothetical protein
MFMNGVFDSTYRIYCVLRKTSIMMMQYLSYLVVCNVTHPRQLAADLDDQQAFSNQKEKTLKGAKDDVEKAK